MSVAQQMKTVVTLGGAVSPSLKKVSSAFSKTVAGASKKVRSLESDQSKLNKEIRRAKQAGANVELLTRQYDKLGREIDEAKRNQERLLAGKDVAGRLKTFSRTVVGTGVAIAGVATGITSSLFFMAKSQASVMDSSQKLADNLAMPITKLQEWQYASERSGIGAESFNASIEKMTRRTANFASSGGGPAVKALKALGLAQEELVGLSTEDKMYLLADRLAGVSDQALRAQFAFEIFGNNGTKMTNMLRGGSEGLRQLEGDARRTGWVLKESAHRGAEEFADSMLNANLSMMSVKRTIISRLMPVFSSAMRNISAWVQDNREKITAWAEVFVTWAKDVIPEIITAAKSFGQAVGSIVTGVGAAVDAFGGWKTIASVLAGVVAGKLAVGVIGLVTSVATLIPGLKGVATAMMGANVAMAANPIGAVVAGVGLLVAAGTALYLNWDKVTAWFSEKLQWLKVDFTSVLDTAKTVFGWTPLGMVVNNWEPIKGFFSGLWDGIAGIFTRKFNRIKGIFNVVSGWVKKLKFWGDDEGSASSSAEAARASVSKAGQASAVIGGAAAASRGNTVHQKVEKIEIVAAPGQSPQEVGQAVAQQLGGYQAGALYDIPMG